MCHWACGDLAAAILLPLTGFALAFGRYVLLRVPPRSADITDSASIMKESVDVYVSVLRQASDRQVLQ